MPKSVLRPGSVGDTGRTTPARQIADRPVGAAQAEPALTHSVARQIITTYTAPGEIVCDPNPGPGLALAEALRAGRHVLGLTTQPECASAPEANLNLAQATGPVGTTTLLTDADDPRARELPDAVDLVVTGLRHTTASDPNHVLAELYEDLNAVADWVWPGGHLVITCRPWRRHGRLLDLSGRIHDIAESIGLISAGHCIALTAPPSGNRARPRIVNRTRTLPDSTNFHGHPTAQPAHLDVLAFRLPPTALHEGTAQRAAA